MLHFFIYSLVDCFKWLFRMKRMMKRSFKINPWKDYLKNQKLYHIVSYYIILYNLLIVYHVAAIVMWCIETSNHQIKCEQTFNHIVCFSMSFMYS